MNIRREHPQILLPYLLLYYICRYILHFFPSLFIKISSCYIEPISSLGYKIPDSLTYSTTSILSQSLLLSHNQLFSLRRVVTLSRKLPSYKEYLVCLSQQLPHHFFVSLFHLKIVYCTNCLQLFSYNHLLYPIQLLPSSCFSHFVNSNFSFK